MEIMYVNILEIFAQLTGSKSTGLSEINSFYIFPLHSLNLVLISGVKSDSHRGTWASCIC